MIEGRLIRIQDAAGRGPFRPGYTSTWLQDVSEERERLCPDIRSDFPNLQAILHTASAIKLNIGCAVRGIVGVVTWFREPELRGLEASGFHFADCDACHLLAESDSQAIIGSRQPLKRLPRVPWPEIYSHIITEEDKRR